MEKNELEDYIKAHFSPRMRGDWRPSAVYTIASAVGGWLGGGRQRRCAAAMKLYLDAGREQAGRRGIIGGHAHLYFPRTWGLILICFLVACLIQVQIQISVQISVHGLHGVSWGAGWRGALPRDQRWRRLRGRLWW